jgi:type III secretion system YscD/HrpQ family protein
MPPHLIAEEGPLKGKILSLEGKDEWIIGRDPDVADLVLEDTTVSRKHLICKKEEDGLVLLDLSQTNPILVNDQTIGEEHLLKEGDFIKIGQNIFLYSEEALPIFDDTPLPPPEREKLPALLPEEALPTVIEEELPALVEEPPLEKEESPHDEEPFIEEEEKIEGPSYDTIFEPEMEEEEQEFAFPPIAEPPFYLKVIAGPNSGAEFGMEPGKEYVLGKDPESSDIAFNDMSVSRKHAKITIDSDRKIFIEDLGSKNKTYVNAEEIKEKKEILPNDLITIGTSLFLIVDKESPAETIYSEVPPLEKAFTPRKEEKKEKLSKEKELFDWRRVVIPKSALIVAASFLFVLFMVFLSLFSLVKPHTLQIATKDVSKDLKKMMEKYGGIEFSYNPKNESLFLLGHVLTAIDHEELLYSLNQIPSIAHLEDNIIIDEYVWKNMNDLLSENVPWRGINIYSPSPGKFILSGFVKEPKESEDLMNYLHIHFPYTDRLENHVVVESILNTQIATLLLSKGYEGINFQLMGGELILTGNYDAKTKENYQKTLKMLKTLEGIRSIKDLSLATSANSARIDLTPKYQVTGFASQGKENFGIVINGQIITSGEMLDGMKVTAIEPNLILLEKENLKYKINYSR